MDLDDYQTEPGILLMIYHMMEPGYNITNYVAARYFNLP